jgi:hypothetical protein
MEKLDERLGKLVSELDTAAGMLIVASMTDSTVNKAHKLVLDVSLALDEIINEYLISEEEM